MSLSIINTLALVMMTWWSNFSTEHQRQSFKHPASFHIIENVFPTDSCFRISRFFDHGNEKSSMFREACNFFKTTHIFQVWVETGHGTPLQKHAFRQSSLRFMCVERENSSHGKIESECVCEISNRKNTSKKHAFCSRGGTDSSC